MEYKKFELETYNIYTIKTDKFKNCHMEIVYYDNVQKESLAKVNFLTSILCHSSKNYPKRKDLVIKLEELYQASLYGVTSKVGNMIFSNFIYDFLNPEYIDDTKYLENVIKFIFEVIENPNITNEEFDLRTFKIIKKRILDEIASVKENPRSLAFKEALQKMDSESITAYPVIGTKEDVYYITPESLYKFYQEFYQNSMCNIYIIGNLDMDKMVNLIKENFHNRCLKNHKVDFYIKNKERKKALVTQDNGPFLQANLVVGYNLVNLTEKERHITLNLFNEILGTGGLNSKLCKALREDNQLCYSVSLSSFKYDNLEVIHVSLEEENVELAIKLIKKCLKDMSLGKFDDEEIAKFKKQLTMYADVILDNQSSLTNNYVFNSIVGTPKVEDLKTEINKITKEELIKLAKKLKLNFIYELKSEESNTCKKSK